MQDWHGENFIQCHLALEEDDQDLQGQTGEISPPPWVLPEAFSDCAPFGHDHFPGGLKVLGTLSQGAGRRSKSGGCVMGMMGFGEWSFMVERVYRGWGCHGVRMLWGWLGNDG